jgi:hypothetical protein
MFFDVNRVPGESSVFDSPESEKRVQGILKAALNRRDVTYAQRSEELAAIGVDEAEPTSVTSWLGGNSVRLSSSNA